MGIKTTHRLYDKHSPQWKRCRDVVAGEDAIKARTTAYLRKYEGEEEGEYQRRLKDVGFLNATWWTISMFVGLAFREPPQRTLPSAIEKYALDITMTGMDIDSLAENIVEEVLEVGRIGILVDHPAMPENVASISKATAEQLGYRPFITTYFAESIINWKFRRIGNKWSLAHVRLMEEREVDEGEFETKLETVYRVLDLDEADQYRQRVFQVSDDGKEVLIEGPIYPVMNGNPLAYIPFVFVGRTGKNDAIDEPPLIDLVDRNLKHFKVEAGLDNSLYFVSAPTIVVTGYYDETKPLYVGSSKAIMLPDPNSRVEYVEIKGDSIPATERRLSELKHEMASMGAQALVDTRKGQRTATEAAIDVNGENSILGSIVKSTSAAIEWALGIMAEWEGASGEIMFKINNKFMPSDMTPQELQAQIAGVQAGLIPYRSFHSNLQRGNLISKDLSFEEYQAEVDEAPMPRPDVAATAVAA